MLTKNFLESNRTDPAIYQAIRDISGTELWDDFDIEIYKYENGFADRWPTVADPNQEIIDFSWDNNRLVRLVDWDAWTPPENWPRKPTRNELWWWAANYNANSYVNGPDDYSNDTGLNFRNGKHPVSLE